MKRHLTSMVTAGIVGVMLVPGVGLAQEKPSPQTSSPQERSTAQLVPLKIQLVISRTTGDKKISSLPYTMWVTANAREETSLRMGVQVPVMSTRISQKEGETAPVASFNYRDVGTNIDCVATTVPDGWFNVRITLNDSAIQFESKELKDRVVAGVPAFRNFTSRFSILLKDGQTAQYTSATDPVSGEVMRVDVTLNVLK